MSKTNHKPWVLQPYTPHLKHNMKKVLVLLALLMALQNVSAQLFTKEKVANNIDNLYQKFFSGCFSWQDMDYF